MQGRLKRVYKNTIIVNYESWRARRGRAYDLDGVLQAVCCERCVRNVAMRIACDQRLGSHQSLHIEELPITSAMPNTGPIASRPGLYFAHYDNRQLIRHSKKGIGRVRFNIERVSNKIRSIRPNFITGCFSIESIICCTYITSIFLIKEKKCYSNYNC